MNPSRRAFLSAILAICARRQVSAARLVPSPPVDVELGNDDVGFHAWRLNLMLRIYRRESTAQNVRLLSVASLAFKCAVENAAVPCQWRQAHALVLRMLGPANVIRVEHIPALIYPGDIPYRPGMRAVLKWRSPNGLLRMAAISVERGLQTPADFDREAGAPRRVPATS